ncbi:ATP-dependent zinc metalloprotease FtsH [Waddlia chondrophila]|uniref:ATP-dependent zinc metalloprotease FtsH n=1 Tax=Waddlia chondrophila (strain ATCC VR-1470 / WSU 86-1044) TaxID=716544 RepID=D6YV91_WADCW|nr:ATP-dependent zinc metalloprotease FtsH [Waddlia chondrophila]ADI38052.1 putative cell division protein FtsH [Waddlia chondrophila WSU 86-1044]
MADDKQDFKKGVPGGFVWFLMAAFILALMVQNFVDTKFANVSFSYQLEHLVNLDLIQPKYSRKIALNDNLVTFSGKFRENLTEEGKNRFKFLELLNTNHQLNFEKSRIEEEMDSLTNRIHDSVDLFLHLSGLPIPQGGYVVVDDMFTSIDDKDNSLIVDKLSSRSIVSLADLRNEYALLVKDPQPKMVSQFGDTLMGFIRNFRSPALGIGNEEIKQSLRALDNEVSNAGTGSSGVSFRLSVYEKVVHQLSGIVDEMNAIHDHVRLEQLRSVRNYKEAVDEYNAIAVKLDENEAQLNKAYQSVSTVVWFFDNKELSTKSLEKQDPEKYSQWFNNARKEWENFNSNRSGVFKAPDQPLNKVLEKTFKSEEPAPNYMSYMVTILPVLLVVLVLYFLFSRQMKGMGSGAMNFGKSPAKLMTKETNKITFKDVAGVDEALEELQEIVEFLRNPKKFTALGGHIPKGVLCIGPPGTGKTLIAKAVAGEADRPFFSISGSDFVEMFVGVGASRIRDMFEQAKKNAPCIIFIDEIDAVGRHRGAGIGGGHDEREQTLNQLLVEMDGFDTTDGVILIAATNRPDVLDKALLRPGRFDRTVIVNLPDIKGRHEILKVHAKKIKMDDSVDLFTVARGTPGASGADLENILNEAALIAARKEKTAVTNIDVLEARDKVLFGKERRSLEMDENEKLTTAYHESGHTIVGLAVEHSDPIDKVTIIPRGMSLGSTLFLPEKNRLSYWKKEIIDQLAVLMGGRCAEEIFVNDISSGAQQDIEQATKLTRSMVCEWGMSDKLGAVAYDERDRGGQYLGMMNYHEKRYSEQTARAIDTEVRAVLDEAHDRAYQIIKDNKDRVELMTQMLMEFETLDREDIIKIFNDEWDIEEKRERLKKEAESHKKQPATPPPPPISAKRSEKPISKPASELRSDLGA